MEAIVKVMILDDIATVYLADKDDNLLSDDHISLMLPAGCKIVDVMWDKKMRFSGKDWRSGFLE